MEAEEDEEDDKGGGGAGDIGKVTNHTRPYRQRRPRLTPTRMYGPLPVDCTHKSTQHTYCHAGETNGSKQ